MRSPARLPSDRAPQAAAKDAPNPEKIEKLALSAIQGALSQPQHMELACAEFAQPSFSPNVKLDPDDTEKRPERKKARSWDPIASRAARIFNSQWPRLTGWQWSGLGTAMAATAVIAIFGFQVWQTQLQSEKSFQIAMVTVEDRSVLLSQARRTRGSNQQETSVPFSSSMVNDARGVPGSKQQAMSFPAPSLMMNEASGGRHFQEFELPMALLRQAIASSLTRKPSTDHSELMNYLRAHNGVYDSRSQILIDAHLAAAISGTSADVANMQIRAYDLTDPRSAPIRSEIKTLSADSHAVLLTLGR
jgi:hypothetical protein